MDKKQLEDKIRLIKNEAVVDFLKMLVDQKKYKNISLMVKEQMVHDLAKRLNTFMAARLITALSDADVLVFEKMLTERKSESEIQQFISTHIDDFPAFLTAVLLEFKDVYLSKFPQPIVIDNKNKESVFPPAPIDRRVN